METCRTSAPWRLIIVLVIVLVIFGPKRLPQLGRSLGGGMREFKDSVTGKTQGRNERPAEASSSRLTRADATMPRLKPVSH